jgi:hypothetical protein
MEDDPREVVRRVDDCPALVRDDAVVERRERPRTSARARPVAARRAAVVALAPDALAVKRLDEEHGVVPQRGGGGGRRRRARARVVRTGRVVRAPSAARIEDLVLHLVDMSVYIKE